MTATIPGIHAAVVVGGGQAGLAMSYHLQRARIEHIVLEKHAIGHEWREHRWDSFCLVTPNWQCNLPGYPYRGPDPFGFMTRDEVVAYLEDYAAHVAPPIREHVTVTALRPVRSRYLIETTAGHCLAESVVLAVGGYHAPSIPRIMERLPAEIALVHSAAYRSPAQLPGGDILIVGTGQSGCQIAEDLHLAGRRVHLAVGGATRTARRYRGRDVVEWLNDMGHYRLPVDQHAQGERVRDRANHYVTGRAGGHDIDLRQFARDGMRLYGRLVDLRDGRAHFAPDLRENLDRADATAERIKDSIDAYIAREGMTAPTEPRYTPIWEPSAPVAHLDLAAAGISVVLLATGFRADYTWVEAPIFDGRGYPRHQRGVTAAPGLYVLGLPWLHTWGSGRLSGVGDDAAYLAERIAERSERRAPSSEAA